MTRIKRPLFGGAIQAFLPDGAVDARYFYLNIQLNPFSYDY